MCLACTKGHCNTCCPHAANYVPYSAAKYSDLETFCSKCFNSWSVGGSGLSSLIKSVPVYVSVPSPSITLSSPYFQSLSLSLHCTETSPQFITHQSLKRKTSLPVAQPPAPKETPLLLAVVVPMELGDYIACEGKLLEQVGWKQSFQQRHSNAMCITQPNTSCNFTCTKVPKSSSPHTHDLPDSSGISPRPTRVLPWLCWFPPWLCSLPPWWVLEYGSERPMDCPSSLHCNTPQSPSLTIHCFP